MMARIIHTVDDIAAGMAELVVLDPRLADLYRLAGPLPLRRSTGGLEGLAAIIVSQQVSVASAAAIWKRTQAAFAPFDAVALLNAPDEIFRGAGLSGPKIRTLRAVAASAADGRLDFDGLAGLNIEAAHAALVAVKGIGPWTADVYLMFCLGHADAFAAGDLALQEAARLAFGLSERPKAAVLLGHAERWRPWRSVAARLLWSYYRVMRSGRDGAPIQVEQS